jgi:calcium binding protein 39
MSMLEKVLHRGKSRSSPDLVAKTVATLERLDQGSASDKQVEEVSKSLAVMKATMFAAGDSEAAKESAVVTAYEAIKLNFPLSAVNALPVLEFEARKDAAQLIGAIVRLDNSGDRPGERYVIENPQLLDLLFDGYENPETALNCGSILRDCIRSEAIAKLVLEGPRFQDFFDKVEVANFEVASDAFTTFKDLLTRHKPLISKFTLQHYDQFFAGYTMLLKSDNYVTRRQSLKLLGEILLDPANAKTMMRFVTDAENLKLMMVLLKDSSKSIQFEAFHVFKVFVANPNKTQPIIDILAGNKEKLLRYLKDFHNDTNDEQFKEEKAVIVKEISTLEADR